MRLAGLILAGGRSRRFGADKATAMVGGRPMIAWSLSVISPYTDLVAISGPAGLAHALGLPAVADREVEWRGPLAGLVAGLDWARAAGAEGLVTAPCDTPFLPRDMPQRLLAGLGDRAVVAARAERVHALCALWRVEVEAALAGLVRVDKQLSMRQIIDALGGGYVDFGGEAAFANVNTPEDLAAAEARVPAAGSG